VSVFNEYGPQIAEVDFSTVDYTLPEHDYSTGPNGEKIVRREVTEDGKEVTAHGYVDRTGKFLWHGLVICWHERPSPGSSGRKEIEMYYYCDKQSGPRKEWFPDGTLSVEGGFKNGHKHGKWTTYHENGKKSEAGTYKDGKYEGMRMGYNENGRKISEVEFEDGKQMGGRVF
jgi:hypothetical protein